MEGWIVSVTTMGDEPETRIFAVREPDPADAVARVSKAVMPRDDQVVGIVAPLSTQTIASLELEPHDLQELTP
jgi:hypothetical protein